MIIFLIPPRPLSVAHRLILISAYRSIHSYKPRSIEARKSSNLRTSRVRHYLKLPLLCGAYAVARGAHIVMVNGVNVRVRRGATVERAKYFGLSSCGARIGGIGVSSSRRPQSKPPNKSSTSNVIARPSIYQLQRRNIGEKSALLAEPSPHAGDTHKYLTACSASEISSSSV